MNTSRIDQLTEWYESAERITKTNMPGRGDTIIYPSFNGEGWNVEIVPDDWTADLVPEEEGFARILARTPKPKPAWHDAVAVMARFPNMAEGYRELMIRDESHTDTWHSDRGYGYTEDLRDVTPLIEAKVTDEQVNRVDDLLRAFYGTSTLTAARELVAAALGLETE